MRLLDNYYLYQLKNHIVDDQCCSLFGGFPSGPCLEKMYDNSLKAVLRYDPGFGVTFCAANV